MNPRRAVTAALLVAAGALASVMPAALEAASPIKLTAMVGPGFTISLKRGGRSFARLKPGAYVVTVKDKARNHNFRLVGPGVNRATGISQITTQTWRITLRVGTYRFVCDPHSTTMRGGFFVAR